MDEHTKPIRHPATASRIFGGEAIIISPGDNLVCMLNATGSRIWELADGTRSAGEIAAALACEYQVTPDDAAPIVSAFISTLEQKALLLSTG